MPRLQEMRVLTDQAAAGDEADELLGVVPNDYEQIDPLPKEDFYPNSPLHVPDSDYVPATYDGYFRSQNGRYRNSTINRTSKSTDDVSCRPYKREGVNLTDWETASYGLWQQTREMGMDRLTTRQSVLPGSI